MFLVMTNHSGDAKSIMSLLTKSIADQYLYEGIHLTKLDSLFNTLLQNVLRDNIEYYLFCSSIVINTVIVTAGNFEP